MRRAIAVSTVLVLVLAATAGAAEATRNWQSIVIESFDVGAPDSREWVVDGSRYLAKDGGSIAYKHPFEWQVVQGIWPDSMGQPSSNRPAVLGVQASFTRKGYNYLEFIPVTDDDAGIPLPGRPLAIDLWAWGSGLHYYLEVHLRDHRGIMHTVRLGDVAFFGWKNLQVDIPNSIPRSMRQGPAREPLRLVKVVLWTTPGERVDGFHFYIDQIKVLTDLFESRYDGDGLASREWIQDVWGGR